MFPGLKLQWNQPKPLVGTKGACFIYQHPEGIHDILSEQISDHFRWYKKQNTDKGNHPLFLVLSGAGTGKSRFLDEFQSLCVHALEVSSPELCNKIKNAYVFKVNFENGVSIDTFIDGEHTIGSRMMLQLTDEDWSDFRKMPEAQKSPLHVLRQLALIEQKQASDMTVLLLVDGMQELYRQSYNKFRDALKAVSDLVNGSSKSAGHPFVVGCCSATFHNPVSTVLSESSQLRIEIQLPSLNGRDIFMEHVQDPVISLLVDDMGGHGRALEALWETLSVHNFNIQNCSLDALMSRLRAKLALKYPAWLDQTSLVSLVPLLKAVLTRQRFANLGTMLPGCNGTIDDYVKLGLFRWNMNLKTIDCPYILLWLLATHCEDVDLQNLMLGDYRSEQHKMDPEKCGRGMQSWMHWEEFVARFRCIKSHVLDGQTVKWSDLHAGAQFGPQAEQLVQVEKLSLVHANKQYSTIASDPNMQIQHEMGTGRLADDDLLVLNASSAPASDVFCALKLKNDVTVIEGIQCKHVLKATRPNMFTDEMKKCKSSEHFFVYITTGPEQDGGIEVGAKCAFVNDSRLKDYFGPYAGRAFFMRQEESLNINTAPRSRLLCVDGIGESRAETILQKRKERGFQDVDDCYEQTGIPKRFLKQFKF
jgi:hypothetical protein